MRIWARIACRSHAECCVCRTILLTTLPNVARYADVRYGTVTFTGLHRGIFMLEAMPCMCRCSIAVYA